MAAATISAQKGRTSSKITELKNLMTNDDWRELARDHLTESEIDFMTESSVEDFQKQAILYKKYEAAKDKENPYKHKNTYPFK